MAMITYEAEVQHVLLGDLVPWERIDGERRAWRQVYAVIDRPYGAIELQVEIGGQVMTAYYPQGEIKIDVRFAELPPVEV